MRTQQRSFIPHPKSLTQPLVSRSQTFGEAGQLSSPDLLQKSLLEELSVIELPKKQEVARMKPEVCI
jgi:hypothetical protein